MGLSRWFKFNLTQSRLLSLLLALSCGGAYASTEAGANLQNTAVSRPDISQFQTLAKSQEWRGLLQFKGATASQSSARGQEFFIHKQGEQDPLAELQASYDIFSDPEHPQLQIFACRFPARFFWLQQQLPEHIAARPACPEFDAWRDQIDADQVYLVFPVAYMNSPSSMFGHTFLRLKSDQRNNALLDYAVNFAANADESENIISYSLRGLAGGYPGAYSVVPYYEKIKEYSFLDSRDIWEYKLDVPKNVMAQLVRHLWELQNVEFDYYFFTDNCSYRLVTLLATVAPDIELGDEFRWRAIPSDTIRFFGQTFGFSDIQYRPSETTKLRALEQTFQQDEVRQVQDAVLAENITPAELEDLTAPQLELGFRYSRYVAAKEKRFRPHLRDRSLKLLSLRSKFGLRDDVVNVETPKVRDDEGHETLALTTGVRFERSQSVFDFSIRGAYHDLLDPPGGYPAGAALGLFDLTLEVKNQRLALKQLALVDIQSNTPVSTLIKPKSWLVGFGARRNRFNDKLAGYFDGGVGRTWSMNLNSGQNTVHYSLLGKASVSMYSDEPVLEIGPRLNIWYQTSQWSFDWVTEYMAVPKTNYLDSETVSRWQTDIAIARHFGEFQVRLTGSVTGKTLEQDYIGIGLRQYF